MVEVTVRIWPPVPYVADAPSHLVQSPAGEIVTWWGMTYRKDMSIAPIMVPRHRILYWEGEW